MKNIIKSIVLAIFAALSMTSCTSKFYQDKNVTKIQGPAAKKFCKPPKRNKVIVVQNTGYGDCWGPSTWGGGAVGGKPAPLFGTPAATCILNPRY